LSLYFLDFLGNGDFLSLGEFALLVVDLDGINHFGDTVK
jgi:hypothetical protein